ncbi:hypothetical protein Aconfl_07810 [Algoriphagus confluentis]|uniref:Uncharacterized protein n=1 Tax=Algoriphagus confluentis TaxID=1697556 RepID=A0ABQ6PJL2_9BACT|nr:hypothetical protein Aconfl_07810 [Algoriphagus confluentis]
MGGKTSLVALWLFVLRMGIQPMIIRLFFTQTLKARERVEGLFLKMLRDTKNL